MPEAHTKVVLHPDGTAETIYPPETIALAEQWQQIADNIKADIKRKVEELGAATTPERTNFDEIKAGITHRIADEGILKEQLRRAEVEIEALHKEINDPL